jgi:hypothetical protein
LNTYSYNRHLTDLIYGQLHYFKKKKRKCLLILDGCILNKIQPSKISKIKKSYFTIDFGLKTTISFLKSDLIRKRRIKKKIKNKKKLLKFAKVKRYNTNLKEKKNKKHKISFFSNLYNKIVVKHKKFIMLNQENLKGFIWALPLNRLKRWSCFKKTKRFILVKKFLFNFYLNKNGNFISKLPMYFVRKTKIYHKHGYILGYKLGFLNLMFFLRTVKPFLMRYKKKYKRIPKLFFKYFRFTKMNLLIFIESLETFFFLKNKGFGYLLTRFNNFFYFKVDLRYFFFSRGSRRRHKKLFFFFKSFFNINYKKVFSQFVYDYLLLYKLLRKIICYILNFNWLTKTVYGGKYIYLYSLVKQKKNLFNFENFIFFKFITNYYTFIANSNFVNFFVNLKLNNLYLFYLLRLQDFSCESNSFMFIFGKFLYFNKVIDSLNINCGLNNGFISYIYNEFLLLTSNSNRFFKKFNIRFNKRKRFRFRFYHKYRTRKRKRKYTFFLRIFKSNKYV